MKVFFDSSAFAKRYIDEPGSDKVEQLVVEATEIAICMICVPEIISALMRLKHENKITSSHYRSAKNAFLVDIEDAALCLLTPITIKKSIEIIENNKIRGMDSLHIASALDWKSDIFVSADHRQINAARNSGLRIAAL